MMQVVNITGWKWNTIEEFQVSCDAGDLYFGFPIAGNKTDCCMLALENRNSVGDLLFYYVSDNVQFPPFLGAPTNFDVNLGNDEL